jgi:6-phosphogluconolactonase (cycloisomerase 2 family)
MRSTAGTTRRRAATLTRRTFLKDVSVLASLPAVGGASAIGQAGRTGPMLAYVGTYSSGGNTAGGRGIHICEQDPATGALRERDVFTTPASPSWLTFNRSRTHLYAANEVSNFEGGSTGSVSAYAVDRPSGRLTFVNAVSSGGSGATHMSLHPSGRFAFVANYGGGSVAVLPIRETGELGSATDVKRHQGAVGPARATNAPPGSFAVSGHNAPHAHMIAPDPSGRFVLATDLGLDLIFVWRFDATTGMLIAADPPSIALPAGDGPRHFAFHPNGRWLYSLQEEASTIVTFEYDAANGRLSPRHSVSTLPKGFAGTNFTSGILLSPDARFVYVANRLHDTIAWFSIGAGGALTWAGEEWTRGDYPRSFAFDPAGRFLYSCNQRSDAVTAFRVEGRTGRLTFTGHYTPVGAPSLVVFLD